MVTYGFFNSVNGDRKYDANQMTEFYNGIVTEGVFQHIANGLEVTGAVASDNTLMANIDSGRVIIQNRWLNNTASYAVNLEAPDQVYGRIDAIVVRLDMDNRVITFEAKTGTPSSSPVAPSLTRTDKIYEICLAYATVAANTTSAPVITDKRSDSDLCGWASVAQAASGEVETILNALKTGYDGTTYSTPAAEVNGSDQKLQNQILELKKNENAIIFSYGTAKGYWNTSGTYVPNSTYIGTVPIDVEPTYKGFNYYSLSNIDVCAVFWDDQNTVISSAKQENAAGNTFIPVPSGAAKVAFNFFYAEYQECFVEPSINDYQYELGENFFSNLKWTTNKFVNSSGVEQSSNGMMVSKFIPINKHATHVKYASLYSGGALVLIVAFFNSSFGFISNILYETAQTQYIEIPDNAAYIKINAGMNDEFCETCDVSFVKKDLKRYYKGYAIGDSITVGEQNSSISYANYMIDNGFDLNKLAVTGRQISNGGIYQTGNDWITHISDIPSDGEYYTFLCGTNDFNADNEIGDIDSTETTTVCGALKTIISHIMSGKKKMMIVFSPTRRTDKTENGIGKTLEDYVDAMRAVCKSVGVPFVDLYSDSDINAYNASAMVVNDGVHLNKYGQNAVYRRYHQILNERLDEYMKQ